MKRLWLKGSMIMMALAGFYSGKAQQVLATFTLPQVQNNIAAPVSVDLDNITGVADSSLVLRRVQGGKRTVVPFQVEDGYHRFLWWTVKKESTASAEKQVFELVEDGGINTQAAPTILVQNQDGALLITDEGKKVLQYNFNTVYPPKGVDTVFRRSGFIHPLWSPAGHVMTRINPRDHYHHVGIWNPWTHVGFQGKTVDFWNLYEKLGTVRFSKFIAKTSGDIYGGFKALQEHVVLPKGAADGKEKVAMDEVWDIRVYNIGPKMWLWDFTSSLNCATPDPVLLEEYRYGGFGFRADSSWNNRNSKVLTSEGKTRKEADASRARWCMIDGDMYGGHSGILFMGYPTNYNFPEPMRVWPENMNGRGDVFFSFSPTRNMSWPLSPKKTYVLKYRMLVYEDTITPAQAESVWKSFAHPPAVKVTLR
ncbi:PmoA family protein [Compostibacter hankyongensis]